MINNIVLVGNLTRDPETRVVGQTQTAVAKFGLAVNHRVGQKDETTFVDVECWGKTAELVGAYLTKGRTVGITGRLKMDSWEDKNSGEKRSKLFIVANEVKFIGPKDKQEAPAPDTNEVPDDDVPF